MVLRKGPYRVNLYAFLNSVSLLIAANLKEIIDCCALFKKNEINVLKLHDIRRFVIFRFRQSLGVDCFAAKHSVQRRRRGAKNAKTRCRHSRQDSDCCFLLLTQMDCFLSNLHQLFSNIYNITLWIIKSVAGVICLD